MERAGSEGLIREHWGCTACAGMGGDEPSSPRPSHRTRTCVNATASAGLMHFTAPPHSCLSPPPPSAKPKRVRGFQVSRAEDRGGRFRTAVAEANADAATSALAQKSQEQKARSVMQQEHGAK